MRTFSCKGRFGRWVFIFLQTLFFAFFVGYVSSYYYLSRRGMREGRTVNMKGFLYIPLSEATDDAALSRHRLLADFYAPANSVDRLTGADGPVQRMYFGLKR
jgi:hypothetical protein